jgi:hypothetical protein
MPDGTPASAPGQPATPQAPFGSTSAVSPSPNKGHEAAGMQKLGVVVSQLGEVIPLVGATSEAGMAVMDAIKKLSKFVPAGAVSPAGQRNQLEQMAAKQGQQNQQMQMLKQAQAQPAAAA